MTDDVRQAWLGAAPGDEQRTYEAMRARDFVQMPTAAFLAKYGYREHAMEQARQAEREHLAATTATEEQPAAIEVMSLLEASSLTIKPENGAEDQVTLTLKLGGKITVQGVWFWPSGDRWIVKVNLLPLVSVNGKEHQLPLQVVEGVATAETLPEIVRTLTRFCA